MERRAAMHEPMSEERLIEACRQGDRDAFRQLFEAHRDRVWTIARHFIGEEAAARDITQQVFLKLFTGIHRFRGEAGVATWLHRLTVNACLDEHRGRRRFLSFDFFSREEEGSEMPEIKAIEAQLARQWRDPQTEREISAEVKAAVKALRPKLRIAILLKYFEGLSYEEMARALNCSPGTVASRLNRAHKELARRLAHLRASTDG